MRDGEILDDEVFEKLEKLRCHGDSCHGDDEVGEYYTLPPSRTRMMHEWTVWRTQVNDIMCDVISSEETEAMLKKEIDILTSPTETKTPVFFRGEMSVLGRMVKDQYGGPAIQEEDDFQTRQQKKIMENNFYLFGIPRISINRFQKKIDRSDCHTKLLEPDHFSSDLTGSVTASAPKINLSKYHSNAFTTKHKPLSKGLVRRWSFATENPMIVRNPRSFQSN